MGEMLQQHNYLIEKCNKLKMTNERQAMKISELESKIKNI